MKATSKIDVDDYSRMRLFVTFEMTYDEARRAIELCDKLDHPAWSFASIIRSSLSPLLEMIQNEYSLDNWGHKQ